MRTTSLICLAALLASAPAALADQTRGRLSGTQPPTADVQGCVQADRNNSATITQSSDYNVAGCVQAGRNNSVGISQTGSNNTARTVQGQAPSVSGN